MVNIPIIPPVTEIHTELLPGLSQILKVGQVLNATVERGGENLDKILLRIGHQLLESKTPISLQTGEQIKVLVKALGTAPLLSIITPPSTAQVAAQHLRPFINAQSDWRPLIALVIKMLGDNRMPADIKPLLQKLLQQIPQPEQLSQPQTLKYFIERSGILLEPRLAHQLSAASAAGTDFKAQLQQLDTLLRNVSPLAGHSTHHEQAIRFIENYVRSPQLPLLALAQELGALISPADMRLLIHTIEIHKIDTPLATALLQLFSHVQKHQGTATLEQLIKLIGDQNTTGELKAAVAQSIAHISQQQLLPMLRDADSALLLLFGLPLRHDNETHWINFRIEQETKSDQHNQSGWRVTLNFNIPSLGPLQAAIHLKDKQLSTTFRATQTSTLEKIKMHMPQLERALQRAGLDVIKLEVVQGPIEATPTIISNVQLLDEQA